MTRLGFRSWNLHAETEEEAQCWVTMKPASDEAVVTVLAADPGAADGLTRSEWLWVTLPNGDVILGVFPQDATFCATEKDREL